MICCDNESIQAPRLGHGKSHPSGVTSLVETGQALLDPATMSSVLIHLTLQSETFIMMGVTLKKCNIAGAGRLGGWAVDGGAASGARDRYAPSAGRGFANPAMSKFMRVSRSPRAA